MNPRTVVLALALALPAGIAAPQPYPPEWRWRTTDTEHFRIHFHEGTERTAAEVARAAERAHLVLQPVVGRMPRTRTEIVISDDVDDANGSATPLPYNTIRLYAAAPAATSELADQRSWIDTLVLHEYVHILHLDAAGGLPSLVNTVFGRLWFPNVFVPGWMIEGLAVTHESADDPATGRNASALSDMVVRAMSMEGGLPRLDQFSNPSLEWPLGQIPYLVGGRFMAHLDRSYGRQAVAGYLRDQGAAIWPYAPSWKGEPWFGGKSFGELWDEFRASERGRAERHLDGVSARPVAPSAVLTRLGGSMESPRWSQDGASIVVYQRGLDERSGLFRVPATGGEARRAANLDLGGPFALRTPGVALASATEVFEEFSSYNDLWLVDLSTGDRSRLTRGERALEPDLGRDGTVVYVRHQGDGAMALLRARLEDDRLSPAEVLFTEPGTEVFNPRLSPDGRRIAFTLQRKGRADLALLEDGALRVLTDDDALDLTPAWTPDGANVLFASDRGGAFDVYAWDAASGAVRRVTHAATGALWPDVSPDGKTLAFLTYARAGYDLATMPLDLAGLAPADPIPSEPRTERPPPLPPLEPAASRAYSAWSTLGPTFWLPLWGADAEGSLYGAVTGGADVLLRHAWVAQAWWSVGGETPGYALSYQGRWSWPWVDFSTSREVTSAPDPAGRTQVAWTVADAGATFTFTRVARQLQLRLGYSGTFYETLGAPPDEVVPPEYAFEDGLLSQLSATLSYSDARRFTRSISPEEGRTVSLNLRLADQALGSDFDVARARLSGTQFLRVPWTRHTVLALRLSGGVARGTLGTRAPFSIGGPVQDIDFLGYLLGSIPDGSGHALRGYAPGALDGTAFYLGTAELRFPLLAPQRGYSTWPVYLRRVHGAVFADAGDAFDRPGELQFSGRTGSWGDLRMGVGGELRLEVVWGYNLRTDLRIGVAHPLGPIDGGRERDLAELGEAPTARFYFAIVPL